ncbi:hypothetical protein [Bordetella bronchiseptica]|uniref:hypothetical protein n=1 Tax=Bordetella bronchiseptica TaxID=518 RepID=UPI000F84B077|nr:hypothetical protein [Bordetella bronchiseptica]
MSADFDCPYCGEPFEVCHDDGHGYDEGTLHRDYCRACKKHFVFDTCISITHEAHKADCLNGGAHLWKPTRTHPSKLTRMCCQGCGEERKPTDVEMAAILSASSPGAAQQHKGDE